MNASALTKRSTPARHAMKLIQGSAQIRRTTHTIDVIEQEGPVKITSHYRYGLGLPPKRQTPEHIEHRRAYTDQDAFYVAAWLNGQDYALSTAETIAAQERRERRA